MNKKKEASKQLVKRLKAEGYISGMSVSRRIADAIGYRVHQNCYQEIQNTARQFNTGTENNSRRYYFKEDVDKVILRYTILEKMR